VVQCSLLSIHQRGIKLTPEKTTVYLIRHGQTAWNRERRFQGQLDEPLDETGLQQAEAVAQWIADQNIKFDAMYSSDSLRAAQTAQTIADAIGMTLVKSTQLREIHCGEWQGLIYDEIKEKYADEYKEWRSRPDGTPPPGGETIGAVQNRIVSFYNQTINSSDKKIMIVSHGMSLVTLIAAMKKQDLIETLHSHKVRLSNTSVTIVSYEHATDEHTIETFSSMEHWPES
jgi:2,3-bisphosphoglycerate-dependent phosphoglycerate mutase